MSEHAVNENHWCTYCEEVGHALDGCPEKDKPFDPDWVVPTWVTLNEWLTVNSLSPRVACARFGRDKRDAACDGLLGVLADEPLTGDLAALLAAVTDVSRQFWINYEHNYRAGLVAGKGKHGFERLPGTPDPGSIGGYRK